MNWRLKKPLIILIGFVGGILFLVVGTREFTRSKQLAANGKVTQGEVLVVVAHTSFSRQSRLYYLEVQFQLDNQTPCQERVRVSRAVYDAANIGDTVQVHYLPEDPTNCQIGDAVEIRYGTIVWGIVFLFAGGYLWLNFKQPADETEAAGMIGDRVKTLALESFEYASVKAEDFKNVDHAFYDSVQRGLEGHGFIFQDDQENVTLRKRSGLRTFLRYLLGPDQSTIAAIYHFNKGAKSAKVLDLGTWFSDGCFVCTSNAEAAGKLDSPPEIGALHMPYSTTWETLLETHQRRASEYLADHPAVTPVKLNGMHDILRAQAAQQLIKSAFRKKTGLSKAELERIAGAPNPKLDRIHDALVKNREKGL